MRNGKLLAEDAPDNLMAQHGLDNLENVFLKLCISDSSRKAALLANSLGPLETLTTSSPGKQRHQPVLLDANGLPIVQQLTHERVKAKKKRNTPTIFAINHDNYKSNSNEKNININLNDNIENCHRGTSKQLTSVAIISGPDQEQQESHDSNMNNNNNINNNNNSNAHLITSDLSLTESSSGSSTNGPSKDDKQKLTKKGQDWQPDFVVNKHNLRSMVPGTKYAPKKVSTSVWLKSLMAVIWKNYIRLKRNPPVLIFEFILPAVQVILFCLCIGGDPFDVPLAVVNDEVIPQASRFFLDAIDKSTIRQVPFSNLTEAIESVRRGETWGAIHIPDRYTQYLQERLTHPGEISNETLTNGTINIYPDLTNLHLALAMENTFREAFIKFAKETLNMFGYDPEAAELPIRVEEPVYGTLKRNGYLEFMAPGVVISITYVMATGLTALAFILEKRDGLLERSLVSGVTTSQILLAHASVQVVVMIIQISLVLAFTFFVFEIPSHGPFFWVVLLILLQGCTGMGFGLLVSAICDEENTAVMMLVGTFYTNLILAGIIWPLEAMPRWLRWLSYAQPQTLPTETLRNILSRGWGISETGVYVGFLVTIAWLIVFLTAAGLFMRYTK